MAQGFIFATRVLALTLLAGSTALGTETGELDCVIAPHRVVNVSSPVPGVLHEVLVDRSDHVDKGQVVARLQSGVEEASVRLAQARAKMTSQILASEARLALNSHALNRSLGLVEKKLVSESEHEETLTKKTVAEQELQQAREENLIAQLELERAIEVLKEHSLMATISGVVVERFKSPGEYIEDQPVVKIAQIDPLNVEIIAPLSFLQSVKLGMQAKVRPEQPVGGEYLAKVTIIDQVVDAASGTFGLRLNLPNPDKKIPAGVRCDIEFLPGDPQR